jgi:hypothetical protein
MQEEELYRWWQYYGRSGKTVHSNGQRLRVLNSGILNTSHGPDFTSARFELDGIIYQGDVECHQKITDWYTHKHHLDKAYRQVILHLVSQSDKPVPVKSQWSHCPIYTLILPKPLNSNIRPAKNCQPGIGYQKTLKSNLIALALQRFDHKVKSFIKALNKQNYHELFYIYFFRTLGYPKNANTFQLLAEQLNWAWLMQNKNVLNMHDQQLFAIYAGQAGFISSVSSDTYSQIIKQLYQKYKYILPGLTFDPELWQYAGNRPNNHPHFRLATGIQILNQYNLELFDKLIMLLQKRREYQSTYKEINDLFKLPPDNYWQIHYALGKERKKSSVHMGMGEARITELLINVILPLSAAQACLSGSQGFFTYIQSFYLYLPLISEYGCFQQQTEWFQECFKTWPVQAVNQSLLLLQSDYCNQLSCNYCPIRRRSSEFNGKIIDNKIKNI